MKAHTLQAIRLASCTAVGVANLALASVDTVDIPCARDATLYESPAGGTANGAGQHFFAGRTQREGTLVRAVLAFDVFSAIPAGSSITGVELGLTLSRTQIGVVAPVGIHRVLTAWTSGASDPAAEEGMGTVAEAGDATWLHASWPTLPWTSAGGDFEWASLSTINVGNNGLYVWPGSAALVALVEDWLDAPAQNHGLAVIGDETSTGSSKRFDSRENPSPSARPVLRVTFLPPCFSDINRDRFVDAIDYDVFITAWLGLDSIADVNHDEFVDAIDYDNFITAWLAGC